MALPKAAVLCLALCLLTRAQAARQEQNQTASPKRIAIIGGGVTAAAAATYLRRLLGDEVELLVFSAEEPGGRLQELQYRGVTVELGASVIW